MARKHSSRPDNAIKKILFVLVVIVLAISFLKANMPGLATFNLADFSVEEPMLEEQPTIEQIQKPSETILFSPEIRDSNNNIISATITLENVETQEMQIGYSEPGFATSNNLYLPIGTYKITITTASGPISKIEFQPVSITADVPQLIRIDDIPEPEGFVEVYAIDPTDFDFTEATVTIDAAKGTALYKCKNWDSVAKECIYKPSSGASALTGVAVAPNPEINIHESGWEYVMDITPGQEYTLTLTPEDSEAAFAEYAPINIAQPEGFGIMGNGGNWTGFPTADLNDGRFLAIAGTGMTTVPSTNISIFLIFDANTTGVIVKLYDGDNTGNFDYHSGATVYNMTYLVYADPRINFSRTTLLVNKSSTEFSNMNYSTLINQTHSPSTIGPDGNYYYRIDVSLNNPSATQLNAFKIFTPMEGAVFYPATDFQFIGSDNDYISAGCSPFPGCGAGVNTTFFESGENFSFLMDVPEGFSNFTSEDDDADYANDASSPGSPAITQVRYKLYLPNGTLLFTNNNPSGDYPDRESLSVNVTSVGLYKIVWENLNTMSGGTNPNNVLFNAPFRLSAQKPFYYEDLDVYKTYTDENGGNVLFGDNITYRITVFNVGNTSSNLTIVDSIPQNTSYIAGSMKANGISLTDTADADAGDFNVTNLGAITANITSLGVGNSANVTFRARVGSGLPDGAVVPNQANVAFGSKTTVSDDPNTLLVDDETKFAVNNKTRPGIAFVDPTPANGTITSNTSIIANISATNTSGLNEFKWNWNGTNYTFYNDSLVLLMNLDNVAALGENTTKAADVSRNGKNGAILGGAAYTSSGKYGGAYTFDGSNDYINCSGRATSVVNNWTISAWIKPALLPQSNVYIVYNGNNAAGYGFGISNGAGGSGSILTGLYGSATYINSGYTFASANIWYHVVMTRRGGTVYFYVNGTQTASTSASVPNAPNDRLTIGNELDSSNNPYRYFNGTIDEVRIYNRSLSADEIKQFYYSNFNKYDADKWAFYANQSNLTAGTYTYQGFAKDTDSNANQTDLRYLYIDLTAPATTLISPSNGNITTSNNVNFTCNATDNTQLKNMTFYWNYSGSWQANGTNTVTGTSNQTTFTRTNLSNKTILWSCYACDNASQCAFAPANWTVVINYTAPPDITPPQFYDSATRPAAGSQYNQTQTIPFVIGVNENSTVTALVSWDATSQLVSLTYNGTQWYYTYNFANTTYPGIYTILFNATDISGNSNTTASNFTINDVTAPSISDIQPAAGTNYNQSQAVNITANVTDPYYDSVYTVIAQVTYPNGTSANFTLIEMDNTQIFDSLLFNDTNLAGRYNITIFANDTSGNSNTGTTYFIINDVTPPLITDITNTPTMPFTNNGSPENITVNFTSSEYPINITFNLYYSDGTIAMTQGPTQVNNSSELPVNFTIPAGLPDGNYTLNMTVSDQSGNNNTYYLGSFSVDTTPPTISSVNSTATATTVHIFWNTNELANSTINYGTDSGLGTPATNSTFVLNHTIFITGLAQNTIYYYNITSCDAIGNCNTSGPHNFTTAIDITPPHAATNLQSPSQGETWIYWTWTNPSDADFSQAIIYLNGINIANTSNNFYNATALTSNATYTITINTKDLDGNVNTTNVSNTNKTLPDLTPPAISNVIVQSVTYDGAQILWNTDELANATVEYGTTLALGSSTANMTFVLAHNLQLAGLSADTTYFFNVTSCDQHGNCATSGYYNFTTASAPVIPPGPGGGGGGGGFAYENGTNATAVVTGAVRGPHYIGNFKFASVYKYNGSVSEIWIFTYEEVNHTVTLLQLADNFADLRVESKVTPLRLGVYEYGDVDVTGDNVADVRIALNAINSGKAHLTVSILEKSVSVAALASSYTIQIQTLLIFLLILMLIWFFSRKKKREVKYTVPLT